ncbi:4-carboxymuconolactone decarboxylase [Methanocalculus chunghsingensis]|uniref:4-carboxymuconolactone decarboxylase n=1 Tax=Methanocalculus chunghsingensis TaxID=156457 RepID=A0A8J7W793_9EURY|nr:carboxymuconolactone decarboxylase family protein [Methanocalculus chunghsingensis]MBR1369754.1 4-carboxymuconolactone decarboxylase [Methanocalculus chunghsingensis]
MSEERYNKGLAQLEAMGGESVQAMLNQLEDMSSDLTGMTVAFAYGDVLSRPGLDLRSRQLATVAALTALGTAPVQLRAHIDMALAVGCTRDEIREVIIQMAVYAGFPAALNGMAAAKEVFRGRDEGEMG